MTSLYCKPTDCHQYLHYKLSYTKHTKRSIIYSHTLRVERICSQESDFKEHPSKVISLNHGSLKEVILKKLLTLK